MMAYAAAVYIRAEYAHGNVVVTLAMAVKSRELSLPTPQTSANFDNTRVSKRVVL